MATITQNDIQFNVSTGGLTHVGWDKKYTHANNIIDNVYDPDLSNPDMSINAIEIDWNSAQLKARTDALTTTFSEEAKTSISTTGELLDEIANLRAEVKTLATLVKGIYGALS